MRIGNPPAIATTGPFLALPGGPFRRCFVEPSAPRAAPAPADRVVAREDAEALVGLRGFIAEALTVDPTSRFDARSAARHPWVAAAASGGRSP